MNEKNSVTEISFSDIIKMFKGKGKIILCIILVFSVIGIALSLVDTYIFGHYGNTVKFHLTLTEDSENLLPMLRSESFAEKLLLDENGLPPREACDPEDYEAALSAVNAYSLCKEKVREAKRISEDFVYNVPLPDGDITAWDNVVADRDKLQQECDKILELLKIYKSANADAVANDPNHLQKTAEYEAQLEEALAKKKSFDDSIYNPALAEKEKLEQSIITEFHNMKLQRGKAEELVEKVVAPWRSSENVKGYVSTIVNALDIDYDTHTKKDGDDTENAAFINVTVSVKKDRELAEYVIAKLKRITPNYVETTIEKASKNANARCTLITPYAPVKNFDASGTVKKGIKSAVISVVFAMALYCSFVVARAYIKRVIEE